MYLPAHFKGDWLAHAVPLMHAEPFASLISCDDEGSPFVSHLPLQLQPSVEGEQPVLLGHVARGNPHWRYLAARPKAVATFLGPHAYLSPQVYPDLARVPTWNYVAVHCTVQARLIDEPEAKDALLKKLIGEHEPAYAAQWRGLDPDYQRKMLAGMVGFELQVLSYECKIKVNQHRPEAHEATLAMYDAGSSMQQSLAGWMRRLKASKAAPESTP
jgi:transcriptional regulator